MLYIRSSELIDLKIGKFVPLTNIFPFPSPPSPGNHYSSLFPTANSLNTRNIFQTSLSRRVLFPPVFLYLGSDAVAQVFSSNVLTDSLLLKDSV